MGDVTNIISSLGFPIFVAVWMLYKGSKDSESLKETVNELRIAITELTSKLDGLSEKKDEK